MTPPKQKMNFLRHSITFVQVTSTLSSKSTYLQEQDQKSIDAIESDLISEPSLIIDDNIIEELPDGCSGPVV